MKLYNFYYSRFSENAHIDDHIAGRFEYKQMKIITPELNIFVYTSNFPVEDDHTNEDGKKFLVATCELAILENDKPVNELAVTRLKQIELNKKINEF